MSACAKLRKGWVLPSSLPEHGFSEPTSGSAELCRCESSDEYECGFGIYRCLSPASEMFWR
jgi:hypothetical protein